MSENGEWRVYETSLILSKQVWSASLRMGSSASTNPQVNNLPEYPEEDQTIDEIDKVQSSDMEGEASKDDIYNEPSRNDESSEVLSYEQNATLIEAIDNGSYDEGESMGNRVDNTSEDLPPIVRQI